MDIVTKMTKKMLERRHYVSIEFTEDDECGKKPRFIASKEDDDVTVFFIEHNKVTHKVIKSIISITKTEHIIIVYAFSLTPDAKQIVNNAFSLTPDVKQCTDTQVYRFEVFSFDEMSYDPIDIVPSHVKINNKPAEWNKLPIILTTDIIARYYWFQHGDVIAIDENDYTSYRKCIKLT